MDPDSLRVPLVSGPGPGQDYPDTSCDVPARTGGNAPCCPWSGIIGLMQSCLMLACAVRNPCAMGTLCFLYSLCVLWRRLRQRTFCLWLEKGLLLILSSIWFILGCSEILLDSFGGHGLSGDDWKLLIGDVGDFVSWGCLLIVLAVWSGLDLYRNRWKDFIVCSHYSTRLAAMPAPLVEFLSLSCCFFITTYAPCIFGALLLVLVLFGLCSRERSCSGVMISTKIYNLIAYVQLTWVFVAYSVYALSISFNEEICSILSKQYISWYMSLVLAISPCPTSGSIVSLMAIQISSLLCLGLAKLQGAHNTSQQGRSDYAFGESSIAARICISIANDIFKTVKVDMSMLIQLITAFVASNALSIICIILVGVSMMTKNVNRYLGTSVYFTVLMWQYGIVIHQEFSTAFQTSEILRWLGATGMTMPTLWCLFLSIYLMWSVLDRPREEEIVRMNSVWASIRYNERQSWQSHDWIRYYLLRYHLDIVLVSVICLCSIDNDFIHGGYLALSLFFFRSKIALRRQRNSLFKWLPMYNMIVILIYIMYQAPFEEYMHFGWMEESQSCTLGHLFGLYKFEKESSNGTKFSLSRQGVLTDILLWTLLRLQTHLFGSDLYQQVVDLLEQEEDVQRQVYVQEKRNSEWLQANHVIKVTEKKMNRKRRIQRITRVMNRSVDTMVSVANPMRTDYNFLENVEEDSSDVNASLVLAGSVEANMDSGDVDSTEILPSSVQKIRSMWSYMTSKADRRESNIAYVFFIVAYVSDLSLATLLLPLSAFLYALVSIKPARAYWQFVLIYTETIIVLSYLYQVPARLHCGFLSDSFIIVAEFCGLHSNTLGTLPVFFVYLSVLFHSFGLVSRNLAKERVSTSEVMLASDSSVRSSSWTGIMRFLSQAFAPHEVPVSFLLVEFKEEGSNMIRGRSSESYFAELMRSSIQSNMVCLNIEFYSFVQENCRALDLEQKDDSVRVLFKISATSLAHTEVFLNPAKSAAKSILESDLPGKIVSVDHHSSQSHDWYALTVLFDWCTFIFVALVYNKMVKGPGSIQEITSQHVVPLGYLTTLMVLFAFFILDRLVYTLGSQAGKACLHLIQVLVSLWYSEAVTWSMGSSVATHMFYLRILLVLRCISFALSALQLRSGYPPPASYSNGMGRHTLVFMRSISLPSAILFHIFVSIPFVYEIRQILDWTCTTTTLTLYDWFKLEDINMSLYFAAVMQYSNSFKPLGQKQPSYLKVFQGFLFLFCILILLWLPLFMFSSGNPITDVPSVIGFANNVSLMASGSVATESVEGFNYNFNRLLFGSGEENANEWGPLIQENTSLPRPLERSFTLNQFQLLCSSPDSVNLWNLSPPSLEFTQEMLTNHHLDLRMSFSWQVTRSTPLNTDHGGPVCSGSITFPLAWESRQSLANSLIDFSSNGNWTEIKRRAANQSITSDVDSSRALIPSFFYFRGDACETRPITPSDLDIFRAIPGAQYHANVSWADVWLSCATKLSSGDSMDGGRVFWWVFDCYFVDSGGTRLGSLDQSTGVSFNTCPGKRHGPMLMGLFSRTSSGLLGETISRFGVIGLYSVFVYGIGRFLRLSITNLRMRIPYENFPSTERLMSLCQDVYIARSENLLELEEELYAALLAVYRLPNVMYELTLKKNN